MLHVAAAYGVAERAARESYGKLVAFLAKRCGGVDAAEDALADAFASALERWPTDGVPRSPEAWLLVAARNRFVDRARRAQRADAIHERLAVAARQAQATFERSHELEDERLGLMFACAHPAISEAVRAPLMLQAILGLDAARIGSAFLVAPAAMGQRLVRAKQKIARAGIPFAIPSVDTFPARLDVVLDAIYVAFAQGWDDPDGTDPHARGLATEAIWLGRVLADACDHEPEALGLLALMLYASSRIAARRSGDGAYVPLDAQDIARWDKAAIAEAESLLASASQAHRVGRFQLEAAIQSAHIARRRSGANNWIAIVALYDALLALTNSPVVALNRAIAIGNADGSAAGLNALDAIAGAPRLALYQPYWAARAHLLRRDGRIDEAHVALERALGMTVDPAVRAYLRAQLSPGR